MARVGDIQMALGAQGLMDAYMVFKPLAMVVAVVLAHA
jgi:hypothetical protein